MGPTVVAGPGEYPPDRVRVPGAQPQEPLENRPVRVPLNRSLTAG